MFKKTITVVAMTLAFSQAYATNGTSVVDNNSGIQGVGLATSGSQSIGNSSSNIGVSSNSNIGNSSATGGNSSATNTATGGNSTAQGGSSLQGQQQGQGQKQTSNSNASSGGNSVQGSSQGNNTNVTGGDTTVERSAPGVFIGTAIQPIGTCRLSIAGGGSSTSGSFAGGIPIGNDMTCLVDARDKLMQRLPTVFTELDRTLNACMIEGMSEFKACKDALRRKQELESTKSE